MVKKTTKNKVAKKAVSSAGKKKVKRKITQIRKKKATKKAKQPHGRPSKYLPEYDELVFKLCLLGSTDAELAETFGVAESTLNLWKKEHPSFSESLGRGKERETVSLVKQPHHLLDSSRLALQRLVDEVHGVNGELQRGGLIAVRFMLAVCCLSAVR